ncbi:MAG: glycine oxidase ThiO [Acidobacteriia bacterium]|nr:glycine oxidase ThiO [Terriglobia bacterium]
MAIRVVVVGAGIIGGSIAWRLAQRGAEVTLVDAGAMGGEASSAGAGMLATGGEIVSPHGWRQMALESRDLYPAFVQELAGESGCGIDFRANGAVELAASEQEWAHLEERAAAQGGIGIHSHALTIQEALDLIPGLEAGSMFGARFFPGDAIVDPRDIMGALRSVCRARRVRLVEHCAVRKLRAANGTVQVYTPMGLLKADAAVLSSGAWSGAVEVSGAQGAIPTPVSFPVRGHLIAYLSTPGRLNPILRHQNTYLLQRTSGRLIAGTSEERVGFDRSLDPDIVADIHSRASRLLPELAGIAAEQSWTGFRPAVEDLEPRIGRLESTRIWLAYGHYRNGILLAPATAERISGQILSS